MILEDVSASAAVRLRRSLLSVPAGNPRALEKVPSLDCDGVILDLEDSVFPEKKMEARENLRRFFGQPPLAGRDIVIRINALSSEFIEADIELVAELKPDAVLLPKIGEAADVLTAAAMLDRAGTPEELPVWAMIETASGVMNAPSIAGASRRLSCFVVGLNDLRKETGVLMQPGRTYLVPWLMQVVLAARANGLDVLDSVFNDFRDAEGFDAECAQGRAMGFDGKMLIHPTQIEPANRHFGPQPEAIEEAQAIIAAFALPEAQNLNVINMNGRMVERLHLLEAQKLVHKAQSIAERKKRS
ncbi:CoA ester lyase [Rhizobium sp. LC145]|uniref:HpcH/HpaI aldolase/citrate lyase family protein n=1 Tax=Rhizobium sp. LC145 TaxID=1120688 RepID=UPI00062A1196|nr:CoA ester lyase [Rhizobium sp. LC145]KKX26662.1 ATP-binding protein [Rhizobium sp. LC145]TKT55230.1 CoA ester lyase [Rhizobiaceae bacterium LC148]